MTKHQELLKLIHRGKNPYDGFPVREWSGTWYNDPGARREIFKSFIDVSKPGIIVEVGSFVGESAIFNCFFFLYVAAKGPGIWSVDHLLEQRRGVTAGPADSPKYTTGTALPR